MSNLLIAEAMVAAYNSQNADAYVAFMTDEASEANYRGDVVREGKEGTRTGLQAMFAAFPENHVEILERHSLGNYVALKERVSRGTPADGSAIPKPFDVLAIYSFDGGKCSRVEFVR